MAVDPVEVTDGDGWKVNFGLETHVRARHNRPLPKINQNLGIKLLLSLAQYDVSSTSGKH